MLRDAGLDVSIDHRSFRDQGRTDELPTLHLGPSATQIERQADREIHEGRPEALVIRSDRGEINRQIRQYNSFVLALREKAARAAASVKNILARAAGKLQSIRMALAMGFYKEGMIRQIYCGKRRLSMLYL